MEMVMLLVLVSVISEICVGQRVIDMSYKLTPDSATWYKNPKFKLEIMQRGIYGDTGLWLENNKIEMAEHTGTHVDSPAHFGIEGQWRVDDIPIEKLLGPGVVIDVVDKVKDDPNYGITIEDVKAWETKHGEIPKGAILMMNSGWGERYYANDPMGIYGTTSNLTDPTTFNHPGWGVDAVEWIMDNRDVNAIGTDCYNFDTAKAYHFPVHRLLSVNSKCGLENVANVHKVPEAGAMIYIGLIKIKDGSGGPARIFAIVDDETNSATKTSLPLFLIMTLSVFMCLIQ